MMFFLFNFVFSSVEDKCLTELNNFRQEAGVEPLKRNGALDTIAKSQSEYQSKIGECTFNGPSGKNEFTDRIMKSGYKAKIAVEDIAKGDEDEPIKVFEDLKNSPQHNRNLLSDKFKEVGLACTNGKDGNCFWSVVYATEFEAGTEGKGKYRIKETGSDELADGSNKSPNPGQRNSQGDKNENKENVLRRKN